MKHDFHFLHVKSLIRRCRESHWNFTGWLASVITIA